MFGTVRYLFKPLNRVMRSIVASASDADPDQQGSMLWETSWVRIRKTEADPDPGDKNR